MPAPVLSDTVNNWFRDRIANGAVARDTEAYNQVVEALPDLIARLATSDADPSPDTATTTDQAAPAA